MDAFLPGIGDWKNVWLMRDLWHFHFYGEVPLALVKGRERTYFEHFWNDFAADPKHSIREADRKLYARAYAQPGGNARRLRVFQKLRARRKGLCRVGRQAASHAGARAHRRESQRHFSHRADEARGDEHAWEGDESRR